MQVDKMLAVPLSLGLEFQVVMFFEEEPKGSHMPKSEL